MSKTTPKEPAYRQRIGYQAMLLGGFSALATILLVAGNLATKDAILERQKEDLLASLGQVIPPGKYDNDLLANPLQIDVSDSKSGKPMTIYRGTIEGGKISALAWEVSTQEGYSGEMRFLLGLDADGKVLGVRVLAHAETPGLGDKIEVEKDDWMLQFDGLSLGNPPESSWYVKKDGGQFDQFSGATITPRATLQAIRRGLNFFQQNQEMLLRPPVLEFSP